MNLLKKIYIWFDTIPLLHAPAYLLALVGVFLLVLTFIL